MATEENKPPRHPEHFAVWQQLTQHGWYATSLAQHADATVGTATRWLSGQTTINQYHLGNLLASGKLPVHLAHQLAILTLVTGNSGRVPRTSICTPTGAEAIIASHIEAQRSIRWTNVLNSIHRDLENQLLPPWTMPYPDLRTFIDKAILKGVCSFYANFLGSRDQVARACIFTPRTQPPSAGERAKDWLRIRYWHRLSGESVRTRLLYCGPPDAQKDRKRGIPGSVYVSGIADVVTDVLKDRRYLDSHDTLPSEEDMEYKSVLLIPIRSKDSNTILGVLCYDSLRYEFTKTDIELLKPVANLVGWAVSSTGFPF